LADEFPKTVIVNPATGEGPSGEIGVQIGQAAENAVAGIGAGIQNFGVNAGRAAVGAYRAVAQQAAAGANAYVDQANARSIAQRASAAQAEASQVATQAAAERSSVVDTPPAPEYKPGFDDLTPVEY